MKLKITLLFIILSSISFSQDLEQGLVAYYPFNGNANDESSFNNDGVIFGPVIAEDIFANENRSYFFDGNNDVIRVFDNPNLYFEGDFTLSALVYLLEQKSQEIIRKSPVVNGINRSPYQLAFSATGDVIFRIITADDDQNIRLSGYELNTWQLLTAVREGNEMRLYVNGNLVGTKIITGVMVDETAPLLIGSRLQQTSNTTHGHIDEVRIYNRAITLEEIQLLMPNQINGHISLDNNLDGCVTSNVPVGNVLIETTNGTETIATFSSSSGSYQIYTGEDIYTTSVVGELPMYYTSSPITQVSNFVGLGHIDTVDFCIEPSGDHNDLNVSVYPSINEPRAGFTTTYQLVYNNVGTTVLSGDISFEFDDSKVQFLSASEPLASQSINTLTFNYADINPFETRSIDLEFYVFPPPTTNINDVLVSSATINPVSGDETEADNSVELAQTVIGSYDPNDITVLQGEEIFIEDADKYLNYLIRFQNTGTASAINVRVEHTLDEKLDWSTMKLENLSHAGRVEIKNEMDVSFVFDNINLPDSTNDEPNSHGYIAFKIKPKQSVEVGDIISGVADIYFDFNPPIITNTVNTEIVVPLSVSDQDLLNFTIYPNPTKTNLSISSQLALDRLRVLDINGRELSAIKVVANDYALDVSDLFIGVYFIEVQSGSSTTIKKFIKL